MGKRRFIKDPVWGSIEFFPWESAVFNHFLINRLHGIVQNSSAYKVYPGLKHSRFLHSVGVMHVVTQMFVNCLVNSDGAVVELRKECAHIEKAFPPEELRSIKEAISNSINCPSEYAVMLACIRISALLHDVGHLPYSHLFEHAISGFLYAEYDDGLEPKLSKKTKEFRDGLDDLLPAEQKLHEFLGEKFSQVLSRELGRDSIKWASLLVDGAIKILHSGDYPIVGGLISSDLDADRIDYIRRDGFFSGLIKSSVDYERLFSFYKIDWLGEGKDRRAVARPSRRSISEVEKLFWERFQDYKYITGHHRVHLYDELLERLLVHLLNHGFLDDFLDTLSQLALLRGTGSIRDQEDAVKLLKNLLLSFDDSWLDMQLRNTIFPKNQPRGAAKLAALDHANHLYSAYAENRTLYKTAFKYDSHYEAKFAKRHQLSVPLEIANVVRLMKYSWEREIFRTCNIRVVIADTMKKVNSGIKNQLFSQFVGLDKLDSFLTSKSDQIMAFNFWYVPEKTDDPEATEVKIMDYIAGKIIGELALEIQGKLEIQEQ